jgi:hypothetical protein
MIIVKWKQEKVDFSKIDFDKRRLMMPLMYVFAVDGVEIGWMIKSVYRSFIQFENQPLLHLEHDGVFLDSKVVLRDIAIQKKIASVQIIKNQKWNQTILNSFHFSMIFNDEEGVWRLIDFPYPSIFKKTSYTTEVEISTSTLKMWMSWNKGYDTKGTTSFENEIDYNWLFLAMFPMEMSMRLLKAID